MLMTKPSQKIYIIDDDIALCKALRWLLESINLSVEVYHSGIEFLNSYKANWLGCVLLDVRMPDISGLQLQERLSAMGNLMPIIMISGHGDISMAVRSLKAGAIDFITKPFNDQQLLEHIHNALLTCKEVEEKQSILKRYHTLSDREKQIMNNIVAGKMNKQIAYELDISAKTVELHRANVMQKMEAKSLAELVRMDVELEH